MVQMKDAGKHMMTQATTGLRMKAVVQSEFGDTSVLRYEDRRRPEPGPGEILVRVRAAGLNPVDWATSAGIAIIREFPRSGAMVLGWDVAGEVAGIGEGVTGTDPGMAVVAFPRFPDLAGAFAEYVTVPVTAAVRKPDSVPFEVAAALPLAAVTAWQALFEHASLKPGQTILIHAGSGGVGHLAVQIARWAGAHMIATTSTANLAFVRNLGAEEVIDYRTQRFEAHAPQVDLVFNTVRGGDTLQRSWQVLRPGGMIVSLAGEPVVPVELTGTVTGASMSVHTDRDHLQRVVDLMASNDVVPAVQKLFPLAAAGTALDLLREGHVRGKLVLAVD